MKQEDCHLRNRQLRVSSYLYNIYCHDALLYTFRNATTSSNWGKTTEVSAVAIGTMSAEPPLLAVKIQY